jgi:hypothetical protein
VKACLALVLVLAASCGVDRGPDAPAHGAIEPPSPSSAAWPVAPPAATPIDPKIAANTDCERCHAELAAEWRGSLHAQAWDDPVFLAAYVIEPLAFCRGCHAPEAPVAELASPARHLGVACITCHAPTGRSTATGHAAFTARTRDDPGGCAPCHQFEFPEPQEAAMQGTFEEHARSPAQGRACTECHMRQAPGATRRSHAFRVHDDRAMVASAISTHARRDTERTVIVSLAATGAGHAVPTGDMFRQLEVRAFAGDGARAMEATPAVLARAFALVRGEHGVRRIQIGDGRVPASGAPREARLVFEAPIDDLPIRWQVIYHRMGPREAELFGVDRRADALVIAEGVLPPSPSNAPVRRPN